MELDTKYYQCSYADENGLQCVYFTTDVTKTLAATSFGNEQQAEFNEWTRNNPSKKPPMKLLREKRKLVDEFMVTVFNKEDSLVKEMRTLDVTDVPPFKIEESV